MIRMIIIELVSAVSTVAVARLGVVDGLALFEDSRCVLTSVLRY